MGGVVASLAVIVVRRAVSVPESGSVLLVAGILLPFGEVRGQFKHLEDKFAAAVVMALKFLRTSFCGLSWMRIRTSQMPVKSFASDISIVYDIPRHTIGPLKSLVIGIENPIDAYLMLSVTVVKFEQFDEECIPQKLELRVISSKPIP